MAKADHSVVGSADPREALARTLRRIYDLDLTTTSGGNLSIRDDDGGIWITPAGTDKGELRSNQVARVEGSDGGGSMHEPSSELPFHRGIYAARADLRAVIHAHPVALVAFSIAQQVPDTRVSAHAHALCGLVGFAPYALPGSDALGERVAEAFAEGFDCVMLENHGVVVGGETLRQAFERLETLDLTARVILRARTIGKERLLAIDSLAPESPLELAPPQVQGAPRVDGEGDLREMLCAFAMRAIRKRLVTSTQGVLSARLSDGAFLATPSRISMGGLEPGDLLRVGFDSREPRLAVHGALYRAHPDVQAIAHGCPEHAAGFSAAGVPLASRTIPESYILVREPVSLTFRATCFEPESVPPLLCPDRPVALVENDGALVLGRSVLDAFDRLEVLEATAAAVIASRPLGGLAAMSDEAIADLRRAFFPKGGL